MKQNSARRGFTLIELLVVVIIIAILAAIALPQYQKAVTKARAAELQTFIAHVEKAMDLYVLENGYPSSSKSIPWDELSIDVSSYCDSVGSSSPYICTAKNFEAFVPNVYSDRWDLGVIILLSLSESIFVGIHAYKDGTKEKECRLYEESLKGKTWCDALKANDSSWNVNLAG